MLRRVVPTFVLLALLGQNSVSHCGVGRLDGKVVPTQQAIRLSIDANQADYRGSVRIDLQVRERTDRFRFHSNGPEFTALQLRSASRVYRIESQPESEGVVVARVSPALAPGAYTLVIDFTNTLDTLGSSLYRLAVEGRSYAFSQFEPADARRAFPCWDEPEFKIPWQLTVIVPKDHVALSNTLIERETGFGEQKTVVFKQSPPMPSYLVALATGPFETVEIPGLTVPGRIVTVAGRSQLGSTAAARVPALLKSLEDYFGQPYPYEKLDILAVPEFAYGAMENPGAITFVDRILLGDQAEATPPRLRALTEIMAHEIAHMWFGNLVTIRWWDDLWLKESFASWMGDKIADQVHPEFNTGRGDVAAANQAMRLDAQTSTLAMRRPVAAAEHLGQLADELAYDKGQSVLGMFEQWLSPGVFQAGISRYLQKHEWKNASANDLWRALGEAAGTDVGRSMSTFLDQPGVPLVSCQLLADGRVQLSQKRYREHGHTGVDRARWSIPVALRYSDGSTTGAMMVLLTEPIQTFAVPTGAATQWVLPNAEARGYYRWFVPAAMMERVTQLPPETLSPRERIGFVYNLTALLEAGLVRGDDYLRALSGFANDAEPEVVKAVAEGIDLVRQPFELPGSEAAFHRYVRATLRPALDRIGFGVTPGEPETVRELRAMLLQGLAATGRDEHVIAHCEALARSYCVDAATVDGSLADVAMTVSAMRGDSALFAQYTERFEGANTAAERHRFLGALGNFRSRRMLMRALDYALAGPMNARELLQIPRTAADIPEFQEEVYRWMTANYDAITDRMPSMFAIYLPYFAGGCSLRLLSAAEVYFGEPRHRPAGTEKELAQLSGQVRECASLRQREGPAVAAYLETIAGVK